MAKLSSFTFGKMLSLKIAILLSTVCLCANGQGAPWTQEETLIIAQKIKQIIKVPALVAKEYKELHPDHPDYHPKTVPNSQKLLRLGFHDCMPYMDDGEGVNGCDGCLNHEGMGIDMLKFYNTGKMMFNGPDVTLTNNNGLLFTADLMEEVYTNVQFPSGVTALDVSMKESGKSRADLWAFAALLAAKNGIDENNLSCNGKGKSCGHLRIGKEDCELAWNDVPVFKTGRRDCTPNPELDRPFFTHREEAHPNLHGNGIHTVDYYKEYFGFTARESIALTEGAHSYGKFNSEVSMLRYFWTRTQNNMMNNQMFRHVAQRPQYFIDCKDQKKKKIIFVGDAYGQEPNTTWVVNAGGFSKSGGPFQWFHRYDRCPASNDCAAINTDFMRAEPITPAGCCDNLEEGMQCQPSCQRDIQNDETAIATDVGFYWHFESDPETGRPLGCPGFEDDKWVNGKKKIVYPNCGKEEYAPEGEPLHTIVDDYADNNQKWMDDFFPVLAKMSSNGYVDSELTINSFNVLEN